ncbi:MAG: anhydro-N-acetylmuramic acid kinase [Brachymonas sp.]|nr:anhydro-N-acetylmuramic acid kinase [Brachymonas sp.]
MSQPATPHTSPQPFYCIGLMSGTSLDAVDGCLLAITPTSSKDNTAHPTTLHQLGFASQPLPTDLRAELLALNTPGENELHRAALAANALTQLYADVAAELCAHARLRPQQIAVIGAHGQTVRHRPQLFDGSGYTLQLLNGALLAERSGIAVACDFRSRDVAAGGQGAPLVPAFHAALWGDAGQVTSGQEAADGLAVLNIGGMANISLLLPGQAVMGFDCGPGNVLLDLWCAQHTGQPYDAGGQWAAQGQVHTGLLHQMLADDYIQQPPPKSTGRDHFNAAWLQQQLQPWPELAAVDVQATLLAFTVQAAAQHIQRHAPGVRQLLACGGGVRNTQLMHTLGQALPGVAIASSEQRGIDPQAMEAAAFAWLGLHTLLRLPLNLHAVTGAPGARVLGCLYPA